MKNMALLQSDEVEMEEGAQTGAVADEEEVPREKSSQNKEDDDYPADLSWARLMAQLLHDKQVASSLVSHGVFSFHLHRLATHF